MHNCKVTRKNLVDLALEQADQCQMPADLEDCQACREEFASLREAARLTEITAVLAQPSENFWPGYHERLRARIDESQQCPAFAENQGPGFWLRKLVTSSIPVPAPLAFAGLALIGFSLFFVVYARKSSGAPADLTPPSIITRTVEVPVVQEKRVTRVVYRNVWRTQREPASPDRMIETVDSQKFEAPATVTSLEGFKPAHEAKLTIIKGSYPDEK